MIGHERRDFRGWAPPDHFQVGQYLEHTAYAANAMEYQASLRFLSGNIQKLRAALRGQ